MTETREEGGEMGIADHPKIVAFSKLVITEEDGVPDIAVDMALDGCLRIEQDDDTVMVSPALVPLLQEAISHIAEEIGIDK